MITMKILGAAITVLSLISNHVVVNGFSSFPKSSSKTSSQRAFCRKVPTNENIRKIATTWSLSASAPDTNDGENTIETAQPSTEIRIQTRPNALGVSIPMAPAELVPRNRGKIVKSPYIPPQGEAWKEGIFPKEAPKLITIDAFDTLIQLRSEMGWFFRDILHEATDYNARLLSPEHYTAAFNKAYKEVNEECPCFGVRDGLTSKEWWMKVTKLTYDYADITEPGLRDELNEWLIEDVFDVLFHDVFMTEEAWEIKPGAVESLSYLKKWRDEEDDGPIALCILANFDERMHAILDELDLLDAFDFVLTSREIGSQMPERSAFQVAMARIGISDPKFCMHISADFWDGVVGASKAGWHGVYIPVTGEQDVPPGTDPELIFSMLGDLFGVLHIWDREPENRLIDTTRPVLENGVYGFHEKIWDDSDESYAKDEAIFLPSNDRTKSWDGPGRF